MINYVSFETFVQPTESIDKVKNALKFLTSEKPREEKIEGFFGPDIIKLTAKISRQSDIKALIKRIGKLKDYKDRIDEHGNFFVRFDKAAALKKKLKLTDKGYAIKLRFVFTSFPKNVEKIKKEIKELFG